MDLTLRMGRHQLLIDELAGLVREHPLHERLRGQLMMSLFRSGRAAEALEVYWAGWRIMLDELGVEPGENLRRLEGEILAHTLPADTGAESPPAGPRQLPPGIADFTGRAALVTSAETTLAEAGVLAITGPAGMGKTALALHVAHRVARLFPDGQLYCDLAGTQREPLNPSEVLGRFVGALGAPVPDVPDAYRELLATRRVLVVLDNAASAQQVTPLLPNSETCAVIITCRTPLPGTRRLDVPPLPPDSATDLLSKVIGPRRVAAEPAAAATLVRRAGGSPLALRVLAARLAARPHWSLASMVDRLAEEQRALSSG